MMARRIAIAFDDDHPMDEVALAVAPLDAFSGQVVAQNIEVRIEGLPNRPIRNRTGLLIFVNLPAQPKYKVIMKAEAAGYFNPPPVDFEPPSQDDPTGHLRLDVMLLRQPTFSFADEVLLVSGVVLIGNESAAAADIEAFATSSQRFRTRTDKRGAFALALRLPPEADPLGEPVTFRIRHGNYVRQFERKVKEGHRHVFKKPIDLGSEEVPELDPR